MQGLARPGLACLGYVITTTSLNYKIQFAHAFPCKVPRNLRCQIPQRLCRPLPEPGQVRCTQICPCQSATWFIDNQLLLVNAVNALFDPSSSLPAGMCWHFMKEIISLEFGAAFLQELAKFS